jgi:hypothetical protein
MLLGPLVLLTGCGVGFGAGESSGKAELLITRDYGSEVLLDRQVGPLNESSTAMRLLDRNAEIETSYGGAFVDSINSTASESGARSLDWFYFVNGIAAERGAAEFLVGPGERMWWDYRDWTDAMDINAVVGAFPAPMKGGYDGVEWPVSLDCLSVRPACDEVSKRLQATGVRLESAEGTGAESLRVVVGDWQAVRRDEIAAGLERGPAASGVFAGFVESEGRTRLVGLDSKADPAADFGPRAGLVAAFRSGEGPPVWLVTGTGSNGVEAAAAALDEEKLRGRYAAAVTAEEVFSLPVSPDGSGGGAGSQ